MAWALWKQYDPAVIAKADMPHAGAARRRLQGRQQAVVWCVARQELLLTITRNPTRIWTHTRSRG